METQSPKPQGTKDNPFPSKEALQEVARVAGHMVYGRIYGEVGRWCCYPNGKLRQYQTLNRRNTKAKMEWTKRQKKPVQKLVRVDPDLMYAALQKILEERGNINQGFSRVVNNALSWYVHPRGWVTILGNDEQGIISVRLWSSTENADKYREGLRVEWGPPQPDGLWYGTQTDNKKACWMQISAVVLDGNKLQ